MNLWEMWWVEGICGFVAFLERPTIAWPSEMKDEMRRCFGRIWGLGYYWSWGPHYASSRGTGYPQVETGGILQVEAQAITEVECHSMLQVGAQGIPQVETGGILQVETQGIPHVETGGILQVEAQGMPQVETEGILPAESRPGMRHLKPSQRCWWSCSWSTHLNQMHSSWIFMPVHPKRPNWHPNRHKNA